jgi:hypothetical protein
MPAVTVGLAEIEARLRVVRRRVNGVLIQHGVYVSASIIILTVAALIVVGLRVATPTFRVAAWGAAAVCIGAVAGCLVFLRRRWLDLPDTAHLADRRGQLADRLVTLADLRARPRPSRLAPLLVAQALALGAQWQPQRIAPRRVPRSLFVLLATFAVLASTAWLSRREPPDASLAQAAAGSPQSLGPAAQRPPPPLAPRAAGDPPAASALLPELPGAQPGDAISDPSLAAAYGSLDQSDQSQQGVSLASLPDHLQNAIRSAFHAEAMDQPRELAARPARGPDESGEAGSQSAGQNEQQRGTATTGKPGTEKEPASGERRQPGTSASREHGGQQHTGKSQDPTAPDHNRAGSSPAAGSGSSPEGLMDPQVAGPALGTDGPQTFKLTITSFLRAMGQKENPPRQPGKRVPTSAAARTRAAEQMALSDRQLNDDALRKADIPPEYEDIVRRVYSARAEQ